MDIPDPDDQSGNPSLGVEFLFEQTTDCIVEGSVQDGEPIVHRVNDAFENVFGYTNAELRGENLNDFIAPDGKRADLEAIDEEIRGGDIGPREVTRQTADGPRDFLLRATGGDGELTYAIYTDITAQKERERKLERYERIIENVPVGIYRVTPGPEGTHIFGNQALADLFGASSFEELSEYSARDLYVDPEERAEFSDRLLEAGELTNEEIKLQTIDGEEFWASVSDARIVDEEEETVYFEGTVRDITERKEYEQELVRTREQVQSERDGKEAIRQLLLQTATDQEIAANVCQLLVDSYGYAAAWVVREDSDSQALLVAGHGDDHGFRERGGPTIDPASERVLDGTTAVVSTVLDTESDDLTKLLEACGLHSVRSVQLEHNDISYGALTVVRTEPGSEFSQQLVDEVAAALAFKQQVHRQQEALTAETVVELTVRLTGEHFLAALSCAPTIPADATVETHELRHSDGYVTYLLETETVDVTSLAETVAELPSVQETTVLSKSPRQQVVRVRIDPPTLGTVLGNHGGVLQSLRGSDGLVDVTVQLPRRTDVSEVVDAIQTHWPEATIRTRNERPVDVDQPAVFDALTDKQEEALRAATIAGFFDRPQQANAAEVAETLDVSRSTFLHHIRKAEQKIFQGAFQEAADDPRRPRSSARED